MVKQYCYHEYHTECFFITIHFISFFSWKRASVLKKNQDKTDVAKILHLNILQIIIKKNLQISSLECNKSYVNPTLQVHKLLIYTCYEQQMCQVFFYVSIEATMEWYKQYHTFRSRGYLLIRKVKLVCSNFFSKQFFEDLYIEKFDWLCLV